MGKKADDERPARAPRAPLAELPDRNWCAACAAPGVGADLYASTCGHMFHVRCARTAGDAEAHVFQCPRCRALAVVRVGVAAAALDERLVAAATRGDHAEMGRLFHAGARLPRE